MYTAMKKLSFFFLLLSLSSASVAQVVSVKLQQAFNIFETDSQMRNGIASLYVIDAKTGKVVFEKNGQMGLAPASTQKIITSITAYELLGKDFTYQTKFAINGDIENGKLKGAINIKPSGDPTLGSWRWKETKEEAAIDRIRNAIKKEGISNFTSFVVDGHGWSDEVIPDGWIWQDIGNYYGAGADAINWRENQYDLILRSGENIGDPVKVVGTKPELYNYAFTSLVTSAAKGTGDNAYIYFPLKSSTGIVRGTIPVNENRFVISGAMPSGKDQFLFTLQDSLAKTGIKKMLNSTTHEGSSLDWDKMKNIHIETSPPLDSIIFWFNRRSINLYGEALIKTIAHQKKSKGSTDEGIKLLKEFWKTKGVASTELGMVDGSGLSPLNRVTTHAQATILLHARKQSYFNGFFLSLPEFNGMKMKSGTIRGAKGFTGYHTSKSGTEYVFSFLVNNYNGSASAIVQKMYKVLDVLK
jgi:serine-type D-Ala-D-Ala carboxypeptidase/endopeptidase (penicillin-binding protein 4)